MKILFYLPGITPAWFEDSVVALIRLAATAGAEVHVIVPPLWQGTGIGAEQLARHPDLHAIGWHILDDDDHPSYRTAPESPEALLELVQAIDPDYSFCRTADVTTPALFPGKVRYLMEAEFGPGMHGEIPRGARMMLDGPRFFDFGFMPALDEDRKEWLRERSQPLWTLFRAHDEGEAIGRDTYLEKVGLPANRRILALPLQYQGADNFFGQVHGSKVPVDRFVEEIAASLDPGSLLAVTVHPIDRRQGTSGAIDRIAAIDPERVRILDTPPEVYRGDSTGQLIRHSDGVILAESKAISLAAYFGKPILRLSHFATADWVRAYADLGSFQAALRSGAAASADPDALRLWHSYHYANNAFVARRMAGLGDLLDRVDRPLNPDRWGYGLRSYERQFREPRRPTAA